ncbi:polyprenyl synthetase family protein [Paramicrobacterium fandaimingii]|uniref:polyprenyl synthetase family protein n=1 Tax=Paramicrobacterium fandaimingii TaxID=2708079 RepID=UPI00141FBDE4|nr:polyprenyl synthetase family protein [Microbacterium fandaimingii]
MSASSLTVSAHDVRLSARLSEIIAEKRDSSLRFALPFVQLWEQVDALMTTGKKVRPRLFLDVYVALGGRDTAMAIDAACALEFLHAALVIHDDVIDKDVMRRGEMNITGRFASEAVVRGVPTWSAHAWGEASSLLAGDLLLTTAQSLIARLDVDNEVRLAALDAFDDSVFTSAAGEQTDVWHSLHLEQASVDAVCAVMEQKTAHYSFQTPLRLAATLAGASSDVQDQFDIVGRNIGVVYQLRDDVLGVFGDERETGKSVLSDLREGKETLLIAFSRTHQRWAEVAGAFGDPHLTVEDGRRLRDVIDSSGALQLVESLISEHVDRVSELIADARFPASLRTQLLDLTNLCATRTS